MGNQHGKERNYGRKIDWETAEKPSPPGKPFLVPDGGEQESDFITVRWAPPVSDGGAPILGYVVEHRRTGSPHWLRAIPYLAVDTKLTLTGLEPGWRYQFRVSAENDIGRSQPGEISEVLTVTSQRTAATSPHFNVELQDTVALENEKVEFIVHVVAIPQAKISWYKDGFEVFSSRRMKIVTENDQSTFIIHQAALEDEGEIKCTATNKAGHSVTKAILKLEAPPRIRLPRQYEDGLLFEKGELIRLKVSIAGRPTPRVSWYHNGELLQENEKYEITDAERSSVLKISEAHRDDRGEYLIKGINKVGEDTASFLVTVTDRPLPPGKIKIESALGRSITLSWTSPEDDGGCKIGSYTVEYFRIGWNMWLKAATCRQLSIVLSDLIEGSEYKFRVKAENPYGMSDPSEESQVIFIPDPKRGILTPPVKTEGDKIDLWLDKSQAMDSQENKIVHETKEGESMKRKVLEENARKLLDTPLPLVLSQENRIGEAPWKGNVSPVKFVEKAGEGLKRSHDDLGNENIPPPVPKRRHKGEKQRSTPSPQQQFLEVGDSKTLIGSKSPNTKEVESSIKSKSVGVDDEQLNFPREEDRTIFHGSSELILVLLPNERSKSGELSAQPRSEIEMSLIGTGTAPPISISAPELGCDELTEMPLMRNAVSSTELLHEKTMIRLYHDALNEESNTSLTRRRSMDRKSIERRLSIREATPLERQLSFKENIPTERIELNDSQLPDNYSVQRDGKTLEAKSKIPVNKQKNDKAQSASVTNVVDLASRKETRSMIPVLKKRKTDLSEEVKKDRLSSVEREQLEFAKVRERLRISRDQKLQQLVQPSPTALIQQNTSSASSQVSSLEDDEVAEEEEDEDYLEQEIQEDENEEMNYDLKTVQDNQFRSKIFADERSQLIPKHGIPKEQPKIHAPYAEEEDDSCRPVTSRIILPRLEITLSSPVESPQEDIFQDTNKLLHGKEPPQLQEVQGEEEEEEEEGEEEGEEETEREPHIAMTPSKIPIKKGKRRAVKILKKLGLKKEKKVPEIVVESKGSTSGSPVPLLKPILKNKPASKRKEKDSQKKTQTTKEQMGASCEDASDDGSTAKKKKQVRITEPREALSEALVTQAKKQHRPLNEDEQAAQVLICHYSDIVREFGHGKKPSTRQLLDYEELKAHATEEKSDRSQTRENIGSECKDTEERRSPIDVTESNGVGVAFSSNADAFVEEYAKIEKALEIEENSTEITILSPPKTITAPKIRTSLDYVTDLAMFFVACWLYIFHNELYAVPILCLMVYRQLNEAVNEKYANLKELCSKRFSKKASAGDKGR